MGKIDVYETTQETFDGDTGEITRATNFKSRKVNTGERDDDYIKVYKYMNTVFAFKNIPLSYVPCVIEISKYMTYAENGQIVIFNAVIREQICNSLGIKIARLDQIIKELKKVDILRPFRKENGKIVRGMYAINPFIVGSGETKKIHELRAQFDYEADLMTINNTTTDFITGKTIKKAIQEVKKKKNTQIPGQTTLLPNGNIVEDENV